ncbi:pyridoxal phosphate-dependent aminotransferase [Williamwhitmania taraxaci]|uniref:Aminotransferase n=1 Tax=Williamwhitmania taraxaci TaxID=1640674 RepID=A0A1G6PLL5_9BACT|nr:pyridoxal phosphate-dependent aminotransferase [Williamwhitmania taraxaci]SDC81073.1 2-keto-4-methylthiobutyrate aminotransferase apoenzyme [Williamwhitmania taraxaci]
MEMYTKPSGSLISYFSNKVKHQGGINLAQGIPGFQPPDKLIDILIKHSTTGFHQYAPGNGDAGLLNLLTARYSKDIDLSINNFLIVQGATEALNLIIIYLKQYLGKSFSIMAFDPAYESYKNLPAIYGCKFVPFPFNEDGSFDPDKVSAFARKNEVKLLIYCTPGNPYGKVFSKEETLTLLRIAREEDFFVTVDAVYRDLYYTKKPYLPVEQLNHRLFYVNSFSKMLSITGWRIGYLIAHQSHMPGIRAIHDYTGLCASHLYQRAIADYLLNDRCGKPYTDEIRAILAENYTILKETLAKIGFTIPHADGGYFVWAKLPVGYTDGFEVAMALFEEQKVATIPGEHFSENSKSFLRFNIARPKEEIQEASRRIERFFNKR